MSKHGKTHSFLHGTNEIRENVSRLMPEQEPLYQQAVNAGVGPGAGGAFGQSADYYRGLLGDNSADFNAFAAPQLRQYNEEIVPGISEQFAGMGAGGLSSSGFRNAQVQGATDLAERLGQIRANLRQSGAQGLANIGQIGLGNFSQNMATQQGTPGFVDKSSSGLADAAIKLGSDWIQNQMNQGAKPPPQPPGNPGNEQGNPYQGTNTSNISASPNVGRSGGVGGGGGAGGAGTAQRPNNTPNNFPRY